MGLPSLQHQFCYKLLLISNNLQITFKLFYWTEPLRNEATTNAYDKEQLNTTSLQTEDGFIVTAAQR